MKRTELDILLALNRLIIRTDMNNITTEKIVQEAKISRATFYRYFKDKYDVLNRNYKELLDSCMNQSSNYRELFFRMYQYAQQKWSDFHRAFSTSGVNSFENYISAYSRSVVEQITTENREGWGSQRKSSFSWMYFALESAVCIKNGRWDNMHSPLILQQMHFSQQCLQRCETTGFYEKRKEIAGDNFDRNCIRKKYKFGCFCTCD